VNGERLDRGKNGGRCINALTQWTVPLEITLTLALVIFSGDAVEWLDAFERRTETSNAPTKYSPASRLLCSSSSSSSSSFLCLLFDLALALYLAIAGVAAGRLFGSGGED